MPDCGLLPGFMPPRLLPHRDHFGPFVLFDLLLNSSPIMLPSHAYAPPHRLSVPRPSPSPPHISSGPQTRLRLLDSPSLHCDTSFPSAACCPPANRDWCGGMDRCETWPSSGARRTAGQGRSHHSVLLQPTANMEGEREMQELKETAAEQCFTVE